MAEYQLPRSGKNPLRADAALLDAFNLPRGYWEAKDEKDDLKAEMNKKFFMSKFGAFFCAKRSQRISVCFCLRQDQ